MKVISKALAELLEDPHNARAHDEKNIKAISASLERFGQVEPLVVRVGTNVVVGGNGRLQAMRAMGWPTAKVTYVDISDSDAKALGIALNRTAELADWNYDNLATILRDLKAGGEDLEALGWGDEQVDALLASTDWAPDFEEEEKPAEEDVEADKEPAGSVFVTVVIPDEDLRPSLKSWCKENGAKLVK